MRPKQPLTMELALLGFVRPQPLHGYEIYQRLRASQMLGLDWAIKQSQMYALLTKLEEAGYLTAILEPQGAAPPRKLLHLTEEGEAAFANWISSPVYQREAIEPELLAKLYFAQIAGEDVALKLLTRQRSIGQQWCNELYARLQMHPMQSTSAWLADQWRVREAEALLDWLNLCIVHVTANTLISYPIAVLRDSPQAALAQRFVEYVCSADGQRILMDYGFLPMECQEPKTENREVRARDVVAEGATSRVLTVFAAASLTDAFYAIGKAFSSTGMYPREHGSVDVRFIFAGSQHLSSLLEDGKAADVFAPASQVAMDRVIAVGRVTKGSERVFVRNRLVVVTPKDNPAHLVTLRDLAQPGIKLVLGSEATAIGQYSLDLLEQAEQAGSLGRANRAAVLQNVIGYEATVRDVLGRVVRGEADAGIVFRSDYQPGAIGQHVAAITVV